jgi:5-methylcytosine-specific restriction endonuclease McrA
MCRHSQFCTELRGGPETWSRHAPLLPPAWLEGELDLFVDAVHAAAGGNRAASLEALARIRSDDLRNWYVEHGQNSGLFRYRGLGKRPAEHPSAPCDQTRLSKAIEAAVLRRDGHRCRYCGRRIVTEQLFDAFERAVAQKHFRARGSNQQRHGVVLAFRACADHVVHWRHGGPTSMDNLVTACWPCNFGKYHYSLGQLGLDDPRGRPPVVTHWDGLQSHVDALRRQTKA